jgi:hypothetical protein
MTHLLRGGLAAGAAVAAILLLAPSGAAADSVRIGLSFGASGYHHGHSGRYRGHRGYSRHSHYSRYSHYPRYRHRYRSSFGFVYINPYPVYTPPVYSPPPPVVYVPAPVQTAVAPRTADRYCREYQKTATIGGVEREVYGTACMQPDGSWEIIDQNEVPADYP